MFMNGLICGKFWLVLWHNIYVIKCLKAWIVYISQQFYRLLMAIVYLLYFILTAFLSDLFLLTHQTRLSDFSSLTPLCVVDGALYVTYRSGEI